MAQDPMEEAVNAFKHSLAEVGSDLKRAISNIEKTSLEQVKKQGNTKENNDTSSSSEENLPKKKKSVNQPITNVKQAEALGKHFAHLFHGREGYGQSLEETADVLTKEILKSGKQRKVTDIEFGHGKESQTQAKSDKEYDNGLLRLRQRGYRLIGEEKTEDLIAKFSKFNTDLHGNYQFQPDFSSTHLALDNIDFELKKQKEEEREKEKKEIKQEKLLRELRDEFRQAEREVQNEERQQVIALKEKQQLQLGVGNDLIQGGAGMAMGVALNKPTIIFASLATSAAKVTSRFGALGKAIAGVISVLSAVGAVVNVLANRSTDNVLKGSVKDIRPEYSGALKATGASFLGDENALLQDAGNVTDLKANISNEVGFSQTLAGLTSSPLGATLAKKGINPLNILQQVNGMTTEDAHKYLMKVMQSFGNSNDRRLFAKFFGLENSLNLHHQRILNGSGETGLDIIEQTTARIGTVSNEVKASIDEAQKKEAIAGSAWQYNPKSTKVKTGIWGWFADKFNFFAGDNNEKDKKARADYEAGYSTNGSLTHLVNEGLIKEADYEQLKKLKISGEGNATEREKRAHKAFIERDRKLKGLSGEKLEKAQVNNLQQFFNEVQSTNMNSKNVNSNRNNGLNVVSSVTLTNKSNVPLKIIDTNTNAVITQPEGVK